VFFFWACITIHTQKTAVAITIPKLTQRTHNIVNAHGDGFYLGSFLASCFYFIFGGASSALFLSPQNRLGKGILVGGLVVFFCDRIRTHGNPAHLKIEINKEEGTEGGRDLLVLIIRLKVES
jgi:hypothetical protein